MKRLYHFFQTYMIEICVCLFCLPILVHLRVFDVGYHAFFYFTDYSTGFGGKKLLGEFCSLWLPEYVRKRHLLMLVLGVNTLSIGLFAWIIGKVSKSIDKSIYKYAVAVLVIYLLSPYSIRGILGSHAADFYLLNLTLLYVYLFLTHRGTWYYYLLTIFILCIACLIHHIFCNIFFPLIFACFLYDAFMAGSTVEVRKRSFVYGLITLGLFALFMSIVLWGKMNVDFETYYQSLQSRSDSISLSSREALYYEFYASLTDHISAYVLPIWKYNIARFVLTFLILFPLFAMFLLPWIMAVRHAANKRERWCYLLMQICFHIIILPAYAFAVDYQRWTYAYCFCQFVLLFVVLYRRDTTMTSQCEKIYLWALNHKAISLFAVAYVCGFEIVRNSTLPLVDIICNAVGLHWQVMEMLPL